MKYCRSHPRPASVRRHPYGWRGLKYGKAPCVSPQQQSPPVWVAWIEIALYWSRTASATSPPVWVAWIEIMWATSSLRRKACRHPYGWRGLKSVASAGPGTSGRSPPVWVAWIEIGSPRCPRRPAGCRHPYGWRGLKCSTDTKGNNRAQSPPVWVAWIEIS